MAKQNDNFPPCRAEKPTRWEVSRLTTDGECTSLGTFDSREEATRAAAWDFARHNRSDEQLTGLVTNFNGHGSIDEMLRLFYDMPPLQSLIENCSTIDCPEGIRLSFESPLAGDITTAATYIITT